MSEERDATIVAKALAPIYAPAAVNALARIEARLSQAEEERDALREALRTITHGIDHNPTLAMDGGDLDRLYAFVQSALSIVDERARAALGPTPESGRCPTCGSDVRKMHLEGCQIGEPVDPWHTPESGR